MKQSTFTATLLAFVLFSFYSCSSSKHYYKVGDVVNIQPNAKDGIDAYIEKYPNDNYSNRNWGSYDAFAAVAWTAQGDPLTVRCLLKFDLSKIGAKKPIKKATLSLFAVSTPGIGTGHSTMSGENDFTLNRITSNWDENTVTWNTQPSVSMANEIQLPATTSENQDFIDIDITQWIQEMIDKPAENYGFMIRLKNETYYRRVIFGSSDNAISEKRPKLVIEF